MQENQITEGNLWKAILLFSFPIMLGTLFQQLYNTVDVIVVGRFVSASALACVGGSSSVLINLFIGFFVGITSGITVILSRYFGAKENDKLKKGISTSIFLTLGIGIVFTIAGYFLTPSLLGLLNTPIEVMEGSIMYLRIFFLGITFTLLFNTGSSILRALSDSKRPFYYLIVCCGVNIILDIVLVVVFRLGICGVAIATVTAQAISALLCVKAICTLDKQYAFRFTDFYFSYECVHEILYIGIPAGVQSLLNSLSGMVMATSMNALGVYAVAGNTAYAKLDGIYWMVSNAFAISVATFVSQNLGAAKKKRAYDSIRICLLLDVILSSFISCFFVFTSSKLLYLFTNDADVITQAMLVMRGIAPYYALVPFYEVLGSALRGMKKVIIPTGICLVGLCGIRVWWVMMIVKNTNSIYDIVISCPVSWLITAIAMGFYFVYIIRKESFFITH